jgi:flavin reductase (DIM6/NTAB) family NADH-FMN oxidoreductase RutF
MQRTFDNFWRGWAQWATTWTTSWLQPLEEHQWRVLRLAGDHPDLAGVVAAGFDDARLFLPWWFDADEAERFVERHLATEAARFDTRDLRRALGQYATGVTVVTTVHDGQRFGMTANSFTSVSLNPPLVLWAAAKSSPSLAAFEATDHFVVNVLASDQHHLSRQFATSGSDKFEGVPATCPPSSRGRSRTSSATAPTGWTPATTSSSSARSWSTTPRAANPSSSTPASTGSPPSTPTSEVRAAAARWPCGPRPR